MIAGLWVRILAGLLPARLRTIWRLLFWLLRKRRRPRFDRPSQRDAELYCAQSIDWRISRCLPSSWRDVI